MKVLSKQFLKLGFAVFIFALSGSAQSKLITSINFNDSSNIELKNGSSIGSSGSGVSGKADDKAYLAEIKNFDEPLGSSVALLKETPVVNGLAEFTLSFWFKAGEKQPKDATIFNAGALNFITDAKGGWVLRLDTDAEKSVMYWFPTGSKGPYYDWAKPNEWIFTSFAWKSNTGEVCIYQGTTKEPVKLQRCQKRPEAVGGLKQRSAADKRLDAIGNTLDGKYHRPFNGSIDNFRIYSESMNLEMVERIRQADLKNEEPKF